MAHIAELKRQLKDYTASLYNEGYLDEQFQQLHRMQDDYNPQIVSELVGLFFRDFLRIIYDINTTLNHIIVDYQSLDAFGFQLKGSSGSVGALKLQTACVVFLYHCHQKDIQGCFRALEQVRNEYDVVRSKLETLFKLQSQIAGF